MSFFLAGFASGFHLLAAFIEINSLAEFQKKMLESRECVVAIGMAPCIPCETLKRKLISQEKNLPDIYYIDLKKYPRIRHVFAFKAVPFLAIYKNGEQLRTLTGESSCSDYIFNIGHLEQK